MRDRRNVVIGAVIAAAVVVVGVLAIAGGGSGDPSSSSASDGTKIGLIAGSSGQYAVVGENYTKGAELAREQWLKEHPDDKVELLIEDDGYNPQKGLAAYRKLTGVDKVDALINMSSPTIDSIYTMAKDANIPVMQGGEQGIPPEDDNVLQLLPGNIATEVALGKHVATKGAKNIAVFYGNSGVYVRFLAAFKKGYGDAGKVNEFGIAVDDRDYRSHVTKALATDPDAVVFITTPEQGANLLKILREQGNKSPIYFDASVQTGFADYQRILGSKNALDGATAVVVRATVNDDFAKAFRAKYGEDPGVATDWAYDSFMLLMENRADDRAKWIAKIKKASFDGAGGKVEFDAVGVRKPDFTVGEIQNGALPQ